MNSSGYAAPELLVETDWLAAHLSDPDIRVVDMDDPPAFQKGHIPGAGGVPDHRLKSTSSPLFVLEPDALASLMESLGVGGDTLVVAYDSNRSLHAARLWWVLSYYGHSKVKVLNGGWRKWLSEGRPIQVAASGPTASAAPFRPQVRRSLLTTLADLTAAYDKPGVSVWDVRAREEFTGANDRGNARRGHVPGAKHLEWSNLVNEADHTFKGAQELRGLLDGVGITPGETVHIY